MSHGFSPSEAPATSEGELLYDIGVVARRTGLTTANLRVWESRYGAVIPVRSESGRRQYSNGDIVRLTLLKSLTDRGHPIRVTSGLSLEDLRRLESEENLAFANENFSDASANVSDCRVICIGAQIRSTFKAVRPPGTAIVGEFPDLDSVDTRSLPTQVDLLIVECPSLFEETADRVARLIEQTSARRAIVVYNFAQRKVIERVGQEGGRMNLVRSPLSEAELQHACAAVIAISRTSEPPRGEIAEVNVRSQVPARRFTDEQIATISQASSTIDCECPHHVARLVRDLAAFEDYSSNCENRNAADAEMHAYLSRMSGHARAVIEEALNSLIEFEGIRVD